MKETRWARIFNDPDATEFDLVLLGVNLPGALLAWQLASAGKKVALFCEDDFERHDDLRFTRIFPESLKHLSPVGARLKQSAQMQESAPHLFLQQRMVWLRGNALANQLITRAYNQLAVRNHSEKAGMLKLDAYPEFSFFQEKGYPFGLLCREYRYNHSRLVMEWLKAASQKGARIGNFIKSSNAGERVLHLHDLVSQETREIKAGKIIELTPARDRFIFHLRLPNRDWKNPVRISGELADYILSPEKEVVQVTARMNEPVNEEKTLQEELGQLLSVSQKDMMPGRNRERSSPSLVGPDAILPDYSAEEMAEKTAQLFPRAAQGGIPDCWFPGEDDRHISRVFEVAQRTFYEAKQTGIDEAWFMELFYRYGPVIEELTEMAYEGMSETRDPQKLWEQAIRRYEVGREWRIEKKAGED